MNWAQGMKLGRREALLGLGCGLALLMTGCSGLLGMEKPEVSVASIRPLDGNLLEQRFVMGLRVINPNRREIPVEGLTFTMDVNGEPFAKGVSNRPTVIPALGEGIVEVTATTGLKGLLRQFGALLKGRDKLDYRIRGRLLITDLGGFDFDKSGELDLQKQLGGKGKVEGEALPQVEKF